MRRVLDAFFDAPREDQRKAAEAALGEVGRLRRQVADLEREVTKARVTRQEGELLTQDRHGASLVEAAHEAERRARIRRSCSRPSRTRSWVWETGTVTRL